MKKLVFFIVALLIVLALVSLVIALFQKGGMSIVDKVALVRVEGPIIDSKSAADEIREYAKDASIKAIVLRVDSPGGAVAPSQEIYEEVKKATAKKKVVVSMGALAASGGYYISSPASKIVANPGTLTGSIGVIMEIPNIELLMSKVGVKTQVIKSGKHKDIASIFRGIGREERAILQGVLDDVHEQFMESVAEGRRMPLGEVRKLADGRIFTGRQALDAGLVDELGNLDDAIKTAANLSGIKGEPEVVTKKEKLSFMDLLRGQFPKELSDIFPSVRIKYVFSP